MTISKNAGNRAPRRVVVFGGAGFIGSHIVHAFVERGDDVVVVDGLLDGTGGSLGHLEAVRTSVHVIEAAIEGVADLDAVVAGAAVIVDCMAWTRHVAALENPRYDLRLNLESHLHLLGSLRKHPAPTVIYLGSRSQYGRTAARVITEETPMVPQDVQGVHKAAADHHLRIHAELYGLAIVSLRLPNCFGERQPVTGSDIGLIGGFIRELLAGATVRVYGRGRRRTVLYARDAADLVIRLCDRPIRGFVPLNVAGDDVEILDLATELARLIGAGSIQSEEMPREIAAMDAGWAVMSDERLRALVGAIPHTPLSTALRTTVDYFRSVSN